jgi:sulfur relay (sulfurtransferase) DsrF/TusC family protein
MPSLLCLVLEHAPYGRIEPAEAVRHAGGALGKGWDVVLAFMGSGVYAALADQSPPPGEFLELSGTLAKLIGDGRERMQVLVDGPALAARGLSAGDLVSGVRPVPPSALARALAGCDHVLLF